MPEASVHRIRWISGLILVGLGVFGIALAIIMPTIVVPASKKTPLNLDITQISSGPAKVFDLASGHLKDVRLRATRIVRTDSSASDSTNTTVDESLCIVIIQGNTPNCVRASDGRLLSLTTDRVTSNRKTAQAVHVPEWNEQINGKSTFNGEPVRHVGLSYKWPIGAQKKTYQFFQPDLNRAFPAVYAGESKLKGLTVYKYISKTGDQPYLINGIAKGTYNDTRTVWVEPQTGTIVNGVEQQTQTIQGGQVALDTTLSFEQSAIDYQTNFAKGKINDIHKAELWLPLIAGILGVAALVGAYFLLRPRRAAGGDEDGAGRNHQPTPDDAPNYEEPPVWAGSGSPQE
jgi:hypothetical protein